MKHIDFYTLIEQYFFPGCLGIMQSKGAAYSGDDDVFSNFKRLSKELDLPMLKVWLVYFQKHYDATRSYVNGNYKDSEGIDGRIADMINYLFLLYGMIKEMEGEKNVPNKDQG
jgi:hypothetical protein